MPSFRFVRFESLRIKNDKLILTYFCPKMQYLLRNCYNWVPLPIFPSKSPTIITQSIRFCKVFCLVYTVYILFWRDDNSLAR